jgi:hypothetical protein
MKDRPRCYVTQFPFKNAKELKTEVGGWSNISVRIIQHVLQKQWGLLLRKASKKPLLTQKMIEKRLKFCNKYKN